MSSPVLPMPDKKLIIGVAGRIGSGKSEVTQILAREFGFRYLRYSLVLAELYNADPTQKKVLQEIGWKVMSGDLQRNLNHVLISRISDQNDFAIDGLRHPIDYESLKETFKSCFFLVYIDTPPDVRFGRLRDRYASYDEFEAADLHQVESNIESLRPLASAILPGTLSNEQFRESLKHLIRGFRSEKTL